MRWLSLTAVFLLPALAWFFIMNYVLSSQPATLFDLPSDQWGAFTVQHWLRGTTPPLPKHALFTSGGPGVAPAIVAREGSMSHNQVAQLASTSKMVSSYILDSMLRDAGYDPHATMLKEQLPNYPHEGVTIADAMDFRSRSSVPALGDVNCVRLGNKSVEDCLVEVMTERGFPLETNAFVYGPVHFFVAAQASFRLVGNRDLSMEAWDAAVEKYVRSPLGISKEHFHYDRGILCDMPWFLQGDIPCIERSFPDLAADLSANAVAYEKVLNEMIASGWAAETYAEPRPFSPKEVEDARAGGVQGVCGYKMGAWYMNFDREGNMDCAAKDHYVVASPGLWGSMAFLDPQAERYGFVMTSTAQNLSKTVHACLLGWLATTVIGLGAWVFNGRHSSEERLYG